MGALEPKRTSSGESCRLDFLNVGLSMDASLPASVSIIRLGTGMELARVFIYSDKTDMTLGDRSRKKDESGDVRGISECRFF